MVNIVLRNKKPKSESLLGAGLLPETLASSKGDGSDAISEVSQTANTCTDPEINSGQAQTGTAYEA